MKAYGNFRERSPTGFVHNSRNSHIIGADLSGNFMQDEHAQRIIQIVLEWAKALPTICAVALVGSHARGTARADSDIDLIVLTTDPQRFRADTAWLRAIDWNVIAARPAEWQDEDYGVLWSRRMWLEPNRDEVEIGFALPSWAEVKPIDPGTQRVITDGCRALHDPEGLLTRLCAAVNGGPS
jgi:uncharacterized protein